MGKLDYYIKTRDGVPIEYRYGEDREIMRLLMEGGFKTKEEAYEAWRREYERND